MDIEKLRKTCLELPNVTEDVKWEKDLCFCIGQKMFCVTGLEQPEFSASLKVLEVQFSELLERDGIVPAPYLARYQWVLVKNAEALTQEDWEYYIRQSYELVKSKLPKKLRDRL